MAPVDADKVRQHVQYVRGTLLKLRQLHDQGRDAFVADSINEHAAVRLLHTAIEALIDIANHVIAREGLGIPRSYADTVKILTDEKILPAERKDTFLKMVRFRNRAVHLYDEIDPGEVFSILENDLDDFEAFLAPIIDRYLARP
ncbi:MAG TPA: DUF86 domain-containing protein [Thermoanaerobaculia bacterium]|jgi:uncharacterized protein YutE (UPF0331/DUF86 family)|nr:DUF86 domain-containing protein [Thermoanaerobaculia bacterium]